MLRAVVSAVSVTQAACARLGCVQPSAPEAVLDHIPSQADVVVPMANGEPVALLDVLEAEHRRLDRVRIHQMHALRERAYMRGECGDHLRHLSRARALIAIAHPDHREALEHEARIVRS